MKAVVALWHAAHGRAWQRAVFLPEPARQWSEPWVHAAEECAGSWPDRRNAAGQLTERQTLRFPLGACRIFSGSGAQVGGTDGKVAVQRLYHHALLEIGTDEELQDERIGEQKRRQAPAQQTRRCFLFNPHGVQLCHRLCVLSSNAQAFSPATFWQGIMPRPRTSCGWPRARQPSRTA